MRCVRVALFGLLAMCWLGGCGSSTEPVIPENPTEAPESGPSRDGLPGNEEMGSK